MVEIRRFDVYWVNLDPTLGSEIKKTRPAVIISPNTMNQSRLKTVIIAPMTSTIYENFPTRVTTIFQNKTCQIALDQIRAIDSKRISHKLGILDKMTQSKVLDLLSILFQP
jgi:mRNA interferase MazF